jgi:hypothetical protein
MSLSPLFSAHNVTPSLRMRNGVPMNLERQSHLALDGISHMSRLPDELLSTILALFGPQTPRNRHERYCAAQFLPLTHVCQRWRKLTLSTPSLWTEPPVIHPDLDELWVARAAGRALEVVWQQKDPYSIAKHDEPERLQLEALRYILGHGIVGQVHFLGDSELLMPILQADPRHIITEHLEVLSVTLDLGGGDGNHLLPFSDELACTPLKLRDLSLGNCYLSQNSILYRTLTSLFITSDNSEHMTFIEALEMIKSAPLLKDVSLQMVILVDSIPKHSEIASNDPRVFTMEHLESVSFSETLSAFSALLRFIRAPKLSQIDALDVAALDSAVLEEFPALCTDIDMHAKQNKWSTIQRVSIYIFTDEFMQEVSVKGSTETKDAKYEVKVESEYLNKRTTTRWLENVTKSIRMEDLTYFSFSIDNIGWALDDTDGWARIFARMPGLTRLKGKGKGGFHLLEGLSSDAGLMTLPSLEILILKHTNLASARKVKEKGRQSTALKKLLVFTTSRQRIGQPLKRLELTGCGLGGAPLSNNNSHVWSVEIGDLSFPADIEIVIEGQSSGFGDMRSWLL